MQAELSYPPISSTLSSKAQGKQRASDQSIAQDSHILYVNIRFTASDIQDILAFPLTDEKLSVRSFKLQISSQRSPALNDKTLRLIYLGRVVTDGILLLPWLQALLLRQQAVQAPAESNLLESVASTVSEVVQQAYDRPLAPLPGKTPETAIWLICSVGTAQAIEEEARIQEVDPVEVRPK